MLEDGGEACHSGGIPVSHDDAQQRDDQADAEPFEDGADQAENHHRRKQAQLPLSERPEQHRQVWRQHWHYSVSPRLGIGLLILPHRFGPRPSDQQENRA
ncbi:hypothetical protein, partial [Mesorhizobium sp. M7A.F.Ca.US.014.04.1.1]|uniref:hypothetical protein n=1 Tax=Mesorhizobium sp. M7A.F.Ca.US.014.04.1.1 TaxID=2496744 RepID=UPI001FE19CC7